MSIKRFQTIYGVTAGGPPPAEGGASIGGWEVLLQYKVSESTATRRRVPLFLTETDGKTPATGESGGTPQIRKNWADWANTSGTLVGGTNGNYYVELTASELDTAGLCIIRYKSANTTERQVAIQVVAYDPYDATGLGLADLATLTDPLSEPSQGAPPAQPTPAQVLNYLFRYFAHKLIVDGNYAYMYNAAGDTIIAKAPLTADQNQTQFTKGKFVSG